MKTYQRIDRFGGFIRITEVKEDGSWHCWTQCQDGTTLSHEYMNIFEMGWKNLIEFLTNRPRFKLI